MGFEKGNPGGRGRRSGGITHEEYDAELKIKAGAMLMKVAKTLEKTMNIGTGYSNREATRRYNKERREDPDNAIPPEYEDPKPKTAKEAQAYAKLRLDACEKMLVLTGRHKLQAPIKPSKDDFMVDARRRMKHMPDPTLREMLLRAIQSEKLSREQAEEQWKICASDATIPLIPLGQDLAYPGAE